MISLSANLTFQSQNPRLAGPWSPFPNIQTLQTFFPGFSLSRASHERKTQAVLWGVQKQASPDCTTLAAGSPSSGWVGRGGDGELGEVPSPTLPSKPRPPEPSPAHPHFLHVKMKGYISIYAPGTPIGPSAQFKPLSVVCGDFYWRKHLIFQSPCYLLEAGLPPLVI